MLKHFLILITFCWIGFIACRPNDKNTESNSKSWEQIKYNDSLDVLQQFIWDSTHSPYFKDAIDSIRSIRNRERQNEDFYHHNKSLIYVLLNRKGQIQMEGRLLELADIRNFFVEEFISDSECFSGTYVAIEPGKKKVFVPEIYVEFQSDRGVDPVLYGNVIDSIRAGMEEMRCYYSNKVYNYSYVFLLEHQKKHLNDWLKMTFQFEKIRHLIKPTVVSLPDSNNDILDLEIDFLVE